MNFYVFLKVFGDLCLYFGCINALPTLFPHSFFFLWPAIVCGACCAVSAYLSDQGRSVGRFLFLGLALSCLLFGRTVMEWLILLPPVFYVSSMIIRDQWALEYFRFREGFRRALTCLGIALLVVHFGGMIEAGGPKAKALDSGALLLCSVLYAFCGVLLQRQLRLGSSNSGDKYLNNVQLALVTIVSAAFLAAIVAAEWILASRGISLREIIGQALKTIVGLPVYLIGYVISLLMGLDDQILERIEQEGTPDTTEKNLAPLPDFAEGVIPQQTPVETSFPWWLAIGILVVLTVALVFLTRTLRSHRASDNHAEIVERLTPKSTPKAISRRSSRSKLRKVYREFLKAEQRRGHKLQTWHTSQDILDSLRPGSDAEGAAKLRSLYLAARYDLKHDITAEQVQSAKEALNQYRK